MFFRQDWTRHGKAAPFKRNDGLLLTLAIDVLAFPGSGISENLADNARGLGIPVWQCGAMRNLGPLLPVLREFCDGKCPILGSPVSCRSVGGLSGSLSRRSE
jgi:hypothetical protein